MQLVFKRIVTVSLCLTLLFGCLVFDTPLSDSTSVSALTDAQYKELISQLEKDQAEIDAEIKGLNSDKSAQNAKKQAILNKVDNLQTQIDVCNSQLNGYAEQIKQLEADIATKNQELEDARYAFKQRLRAIYMSGGTAASSLTVLMSADNLSDLLAKTELTKSVSAYDKALTNKLIDDVKLIEQKKTEIDKLVEEQKSVKATLDSKKGELNSQIKGVNSEISGLQSDINKLLDRKKANEQAIKEYEDAIKNAGNVGVDQTHDGQFMWPCPGYRTISSPYGYRKDPFSGARKFHKGIDIWGSGIKGKPIVAAADGIVSLAKYNSGGYGHYVMINHGQAPNGKWYVTLYAHMTKYIVRAGQTVKKGQTIGYVGTSGASTGYHLHYEVRAGVKNSRGEIVYETTNPMSYY